MSPEIDRSQSDTIPSQTPEKGEPTPPVDPEATTLHAADETLPSTPPDARADTVASGAGDLTTLRGDAEQTVDSAFPAHPPGGSGPVSSDSNVADTVASGFSPNRDLGMAIDSAHSRFKARKAAVGFGNVTIPNYQIEGELGRGGMGVVYRAEHILLNRKVALKVILAGQHAGDQEIERFLTEAQAVAQLHDPGIVQIFDIGEHEGVPYFSLEFVEGGALDRKIAGTPQEPKWAATTLERLARAMATAHEHGIIHRDLKPANILLTLEGLPKITDFGLAKRLETDSQQTRSGSIMGTPTYMAPEQAAGKTHEIGPRSDLYSLGAVLYALLTGRPPFQGTSMMETLEQVRNREPVPPSQLQPRIPADLETICLKCLHKEPERRYATARELADDLKRFLDGVPILARPVSAPEKLWRWCRRRPFEAGMIGISAALLAAFVTSLAVSSSMLRGQNKRLAESLEFAQKKENEANTARELADKRRTEAEASAARALEQNKQAIDAWRSFGKTAYQDLAAIPGTANIRLKLLDEVKTGLLNSLTGMEPLYKVTRDERNPQLADHAMAGVYKQVGEVLLQIGKVREAAEPYREMDRIYEELHRSMPNDPHYMMTLAMGKGTLGSYELYHLGDAEAAEADFQKSYDLHRERLRFFPDNPEVNRAVANALGSLAATALRMGKLDLAEARYTEEVALREAFPEALRSDVEVTRELSGLHEQLGKLDLSRGKLDEASEHFRKSLQIREDLARSMPDNVPNLRDVYRSYEEFGHIALLEMNNPEEALRLYEQALEGLKKIAALDEQSAIFKGDVGTAYYYVATALLKLKRMPESRAAYEKCLEIRRGLASDPEAKIAQIELMLALARCDQPQEAATIAEHMIEVPPQNSQLYVEAACGFAIAAGAESAGSQKEQYTTQAVAAIQKGVDAGWRDVGRLKVDPDLDAVRQAPAFQQLLKELEELIAKGK